MQKKHKKFTDDGWAIWVEGDDTSTIYINDWMNPKDKSYVDVGIRIRGVKVSKFLHLYVPFVVLPEEIEDMSLHFNDTKVLQAIFSSACIVDYMKNKHTSEIAYNGKTIDIVHISTFDYTVAPLSKGTLVSINLEPLQSYIDNDEAYFILRMPHKSLDEIFKTENVGSKFKDLITTPVVSEKYGYSIRINETRLLPEEITRIGSFHRQKLKKAVVTLSINESYELNDTGCYLIRRLEEELYKDYLPKNFKCEDVINYQWHQSREYNYQGQYNFYYSISKNYISSKSLFLYIILLFAIGMLGEVLYDLIMLLIAWLK